MVSATKHRSYPGRTKDWGPLQKLRDANLPHTHYNVGLILLQDADHYVYTYNGPRLLSYQYVLAYFSDCTKEWSNRLTSSPSALYFVSIFPWAQQSSGRHSFFLPPKKNVNHRCTCRRRSAPVCSLSKILSLQMFNYLVSYKASLISSPEGGTSCEIYLAQVSKTCNLHPQHDLTLSK
jgi:hypothetical protein